MFPSNFNLGSLNGSNGVIFFNPVNRDPTTGSLVSKAADFNKDGIDDILIGTSRSGDIYLVLGQKESLISPFSLSTLDGNNGVIFNLNVENLSGVSVSNAGDFNGDGIGDILIGAPASSPGTVYLVFGHEGIWSSPFSLSNLNGSNGIIFNGVVRDEAGTSVNTVGDFSGDGNSFIFFGKSGEIASNQFNEQEISILSLHLLQICLVYINTLMIQEILAQPGWFERMAPEDLRALTPLIYAHVNPYGSFELDMHLLLSISLLKKTI